MSNLMAPFNMMLPEHAGPQDANIEGHRMRSSIPASSLFGLSDPFLSLGSYLSHRTPGVEGIPSIRETTPSFPIIAPYVDPFSPSDTLSFTPVIETPVSYTAGLMLKGFGDSDQIVLHSDFAYAEDLNQLCLYLFSINQLLTSIWAGLPSTTLHGINRVWLGQGGRWCWGYGEFNNLPFTSVFFEGST